MAKRGRTQSVAKAKKLNQIGDVILHAVFHGDEATAQRFGLAVRTIQRYRARSLREPELAQIVAQKLDAIEGGASVPDELERTISEAMQAVRRLAPQIEPQADQMTAFAEILKVVMGYDLNRKMLHARLGISHGANGAG